MKVTVVVAVAVVGDGDFGCLSDAGGDSPAARCPSACPTTWRTGQIHTRRSWTPADLIG